MIPRKFLAAYIACIFFTEHEELYGLDASDLAPETKARINDDCEAFLSLCYPVVAGRLESAGHDFWLTRNQHGAGFWDGDWAEEGDELTDIAHSFGELSVYVGDDGLIYF